MFQIRNISEGGKVEKGLVAYSMGVQVLYGMDLKKKHKVVYSKLKDK
jgi:hypothetical protein